MFLFCLVTYQRNEYQQNNYRPFPSYSYSLKFEAHFGLDILWVIGVALKVFLKTIFIEKVIYILNR